MFPVAVVSHSLQDEIRTIKAAIKANHYADELEG
jgi:hypothetical protein